MKQQLSILDVNPTNIWNYKQNHPELIIKDLERVGASPFIIKVVRTSMLARGINKWLKVRRDLIAYKKNIRNDIKELNLLIPVLKKQMTSSWVDFKTASTYQVHEYYKNREQYIVAKQILKYLNKTRADLKAMCMTNRWQIWEGKKLSEMNSIKANDL